MEGVGLLTMCAMPVLLLLALLRDLFRLGRGMARLARNRRAVPLPQKNMTRATFGGFVVALSIGFAATGIPFRDPVVTSALAGVGGLGLLYLVAGATGSQGARVDVISVFWWGVGALGCGAALLHFEGMI
jgi:hypothetical protein